MEPGAHVDALGLIVQQGTQWIGLVVGLLAVVGVIRSNGKAQGRTDALIEGLQERDEKLSGAMRSETAVLARLVSDTHANKRDIEGIRVDVADISGILREVRDEMIETRAARK